MGTIRVLLADQHEATQTTLSSARNNSHPLELVGVAHDGHEALRLVQTTRPDVAVFAQNLSELDGISAAEQLHLLQPDLGLVVITENNDEPTLDRVSQIGVHRSLPRETAVSKLVQTVIDVMEMLSQ